MPSPDWLHFPALSALRAFEATARLEGFSAAARSLNVTPAAVAQQVRGLEADLGLPLARREGRGLRLTPEGRRLAEGLAEGFATLAAAVENARSGPRHRGLRITCTPALTQSLLMPRLPEFWKLHPEVPVSLSPGLDLADLRRDGFDIGIRSGSGQWPGVESEHLVDGRFILVAAPSLVGTGRPLDRLPWIGHCVEDHPILRAAGIDPERLTVNGVESPIMLVPAAIQGFGLLIVSDVVVRDELAAGRLVQVPFPEQPRFSYWAVTLPGPRRPEVAAFLAWLRALLAPAASPGGGAGDAAAPEPDTEPAPAAKD